MLVNLPRRQTALKNSSHEALKALDGLFLGQIRQNAEAVPKKINKLTKNRVIGSV